MEIPGQISAEIDRRPPQFHSSSRWACGRRSHHSCQCSVRSRDRKRRARRSMKPRTGSSRSPAFTKDCTRAEPYRERLRHGPASRGAHEGRALAGHGPPHGLQAGDGGVEKLATTARTKSVAESRQRCNIPPRNRSRVPKEIRRLIHAVTQNPHNSRRTIAGVLHHISPEQADLYFHEIGFRWPSALSQDRLHGAPGTDRERVSPLVARAARAAITATGRQMRRTREGGISIKSSVAVFR